MWDDRFREGYDPYDFEEPGYGYGGENEWGGGGGNPFGGAAAQSYFTASYGGGNGPDGMQGGYYDNYSGGGSQYPNNSAMPGNWSVTDSQKKTPASILMEYHKKPLPYEDAGEEGEAPNKIYRVSVVVDGQLYTGVGRYSILYLHLKVFAFQFFSE